MERKKHPDKKVVPAAMLYYHIDDPMVEDGESMTPEQINTRLLQDLKMTGIVNENDEAVRLLDQEFTAKSISCRWSGKGRIFLGQIKCHKGGRPAGCFELCQPKDP